MFSIRCRTPFLLISVLALGTAGCSGDSKTEEDKTTDKGKNPPVYPVAGKVTYKNQPLANATVVFNPESDLPYATDTDAEGKYILARLPAGEYKVTIESKPDNPVGVTKEAKPPSGGSNGPKSAKLPAMYQTKEKTPLTKTIEPGQNNFDIEIK